MATIAVVRSQHRPRPKEMKVKPFRMLPPHLAGSPLRSSSVQSPKRTCSRMNAGNITHFPDPIAIPYRPRAGLRLTIMHYGRCTSQFVDQSLAKACYPMQNPLLRATFPTHTRTTSRHQFMHHFPDTRLSIRIN